VALGPLVAAWGWRRVAHSQARGRAGGSGVGFAALAAGVALTFACLAGLLFPLQIEAGPIGISTNGIRPRLWASAWAAVTAAPAFGVGASPFLARLSPIPGLAGIGGLWEAHSVYVGVLGQFGLVGTAILGAGIGLLVRGVAVLGATNESGTVHRGRCAILLALGAVALHGVFSGSEDFRHVWMLFGLMGLTIVRDTGRAGREGPR
jgi:O-antigen ligase